MLPSNKMYCIGIFVDKRFWLGIVIEEKAFIVQGLCLVLANGKTFSFQVWLTSSELAS